MNERIRKIFCLGFIVSIVILLSLYFLSEKSGYYIDEGMTLYLANGNYNGAVTTATDYGFLDFIEEFVLRESFSATVDNVRNMIGELVGSGNYSKEGTIGWYDAARNMLQGEYEWVTSEELRNQIIAEKGNRFTFIQVYLNQVVDVHPPLYYVIVHLVNSCIPGFFSNYILGGINLLFLLLTLYIIYLVSEIVLCDGKRALLVSTIYGLSQGFFSCVVYFRMYAVLSFFIVLTLYLTLVLLEKGMTGNRKFIIALISTIVLGSWTHYYYYVFLCPTVIITICGLWKKFGKKETFFYVRKLIIAGIISVIIWPFSLYHILFSYRGTEAVDSLIHRGIWEAFCSYVTILCEGIISGNMFVGIMIVLAIIVLLINRIKSEKQLLCIKEMLVLFPVVFYWFLMIKITPVQSDRYVFCIMPMCCLIIVWIIFAMCKVLNQREKYAYCAVIILLICNLIGTLRPNYLYREQKDLQLGVTKNNDLNCLMIMDDDASAYAYVPYLLDFNEILAIGFNDIGVLEEIRPTDSDASIVLYIADYLETDLLVKEAACLLDASKVSDIDSDFMGVKAFLLER